MTRRAGTPARSLGPAQAIGLGLVALACITVVGLVSQTAVGDAPSSASSVSSVSSSGSSSGPVVLTAYQKQLQEQVVDVAGAPRTGRDPANQRQVSLAEAAGQAPGPVVIASAAPRPVTTPRDPKQVLGDPKTSGILSNGCLNGYGRADQCVPARAPGNAPQNCAYVVKQFPDGVVIRGRDTAGLDTNRDGWACDVGDAGVPAQSADHHEHAAGS